MSEKLYSLAYLSRSMLDLRDSFAQLELLNILLVSRLHNGRAGITGCLLLNQGCFAQVLEGSQHAVEAAFERVECDPRHRSISVLHFKPLERRTFPDWAMAHACADQSSQALHGFSSRGELGLKGLKGAGDDLADVLRSLVSEEYNAA